MLKELFRRGDVTLASGLKSDFKIDCDALSDSDLACIAFMLSLRLQPFSMVEGVPEGGLRLAGYMRSYVSDSGPLLIVDDVFTTGMSINRCIAANRWGEEPYIGAVIFARNPTPKWITPLFICSEEVR